MQNVLGYTPIQGGSAYLPVTAVIIVAAGISLRAHSADRHPPDHRGRRADRRRRTVTTCPGSLSTARYPPTCCPASLVMSSGSAPCSSPSPAPPTPASPRTRPDSPPGCSTPHCNSGPRSGWRSSPPSPPPHQPPARVRKPPARCPHRRLLPSVARRGHLRRHCRADRLPRPQHPNGHHRTPSGLRPRRSSRRPRRPGPGSEPERKDSAREVPAAGPLPCRLRHLDATQRPGP